MRELSWRRKMRNKKKTWERGLDCKIRGEIKEAERIMRKLKKQPDPMMSKLLGFHMMRITAELTVRKTSKHLSEEMYEFDVDEEGDYVFDFKGAQKNADDVVDGYL